MNVLFNLTEVLGALILFFVFGMGFGFFMGVIRYFTIGVFESSK